MQGPVIWNSVHEKLPPKYRLVLVKFSGGEEFPLGIISAGYFKDTFFVVPGRRGEKSIGRETHWCDLPKGFQFGAMIND